MNSLRESAEYKMGREAQIKVLHALQAGGYLSIETDEWKRTGAPMGVNIHKAEILPDIFSFTAGTACLVEVKGKTAPAFSRNMKALVHGIEERHWQHYSEVGRDTGLVVFIAVYEDDDDKILLQSQNGLIRCGRGKIRRGPHKHHGRDKPKTPIPMYYFRRDWFVEVGSCAQPALFPEMLLADPGPLPQPPEVVDYFGPMPASPGQVSQERLRELNTAWATR